MLVDTIDFGADGEVLGGLKETFIVMNQESLYIKGGKSMVFSDGGGEYMGHGGMGLDFDPSARGGPTCKTLLEKPNKKVEEAEGGMLDRKNFDRGLGQSI